MARANDLAFLREVLHSGADIVTAMPVAARTLKRLIPAFSLSMIRVDARCAPQTHYSEFFDEFSHRLFGQMGHQIAAANNDPAAFGHLLQRRGRPFGSLIDNAPGYLQGATYQMLFQRNGIHHCLDVAIRDAHGPLGILGIFRERDAPAFTHKELAVVDALYPHLVHACAAQSLPTEHDEIDSALIVANLDGTIQWASPQAREWLGQASGAPGWTALMTHDVLPQACRDLCRRWQDGRVTRRSLGEQPQAPTLVLPVPGGRLRLRAYGLSARTGESAHIGIQMRLEMSRPLRIQRVLESCALSPQLRRIAFAMTQGATTPHLREQLGIGAETLRSYQKDLYARLGVNGAEALVRLIHERAQRVSLDLSSHRPVAAQQSDPFPD